MAKFIGLSVRLEIPKLIMPYIDLVDNQSVGLLIREAMRSAARPAAVVLKGLLKVELSKSEQSTGATERSVAVKYGRSKVDKNRFYVIVGINKTHFEYHTATIPEGRKTKLRRGRGQRGLGLFGLQTRMNRKGVLRSKQVFSRFRSQPHIDRLKGKPLKRRPSKYFHMIDKGFNHRSGVRGRNYEFIHQLRQRVSKSMQEMFVKRLKELLLPVIKKELLRKYKSVLR